MGGMIWGMASGCWQSNGRLTKSGVAGSNPASKNTSYAWRRRHTSGRRHPGPEEDHEINPLGVEGIGGVGIVGGAAAAVNAVFHATGKRVRDLLILMDKLLV